MELKEIMELIRAVDNSKLSDFKLSTGDFTLKMTKHSVVGRPAPSVPQPAAQPVTELPATTSYEDLMEPITIIPQEPEKKLAGNTVDSPIVGTFYRSPAPDKPPFVVEGDSVKKGDVLCLIEAMKVINEITSRYDGVVTEILPENGNLVEYGQPLFRIE